MLKDSNRILQDCKRITNTIDQRKRQLSDVKQTQSSQEGELEKLQTAKIALRLEILNTKEPLKKQKLERSIARMQAEVIKLASEIENNRKTANVHRAAIKQLNASFNDLGCPALRSA